ncbi:MAG: RND family transporter [Nitrospirota bacterium]
MSNNRYKSRIEAYGRWIIRFRWPVVILSVLLTIIAAMGMKYIQFENDYRYYFSKENPQLINFETLQSIYNKNDNLLLVLEPEGGEVFTPSVLDAVEEITREAWKIPYAIRVDSITNFQRTRVIEDNLYIEDLIKSALEKSVDELREARQIALAEPLLKNRLISNRAHVTGVNVTLELPGKESDEQARVVIATRVLAEKIKERHPGINIYITGLVALDNAFAEATINDMKSLIPLMYLGIILAMIFMLRSFSGTFATLCVILFSTLMAMGISGWIEIPLSAPSAIAPTMIMTLAVADCIHILVTILLGMRLGRSKQDAIVESLRVNMQTVFITSLTTAIGFLSMNFSDAPPFRDLGNITAIGIIAAFFYAVIFLPAMVAILPARVKTCQKTHTPSLECLANFVIEKRHPILWGCLSVVLLMSVMITRNDLNDSWLEYFSEGIQFRRETDFIHKNLTGIYLIEYSPGAGESYGITRPEYLDKLEEFAIWWRSQPNVIHVNSFSEIMKRLNKNMHEDDPTYYQVPEDRRLASQYLLLYEMSLPYGLDLNNQINVDKSSTRFTVTMQDISMKQIKEASLKGEAWLKANAPESMFSPSVGTAVMFTYITERNIKSMLIGTLVAIILISLTLILTFRNIRYGLLSLIPNLVPAIISFGLWGIFVGEVNIGISIVSAMTLGIVVDDTVHFLNKYIRAQREQRLDTEDAIRYAFSSVGIAMITTSVILFAGFMILSFSSFNLNASMGRLTAITIAIALIADFLLLPALLLWMEKRKGLPIESHIRVISKNPQRQPDNKMIGGFNESTL